MLIREARITDAAGIARVHVDTWRSAYRGIISDEFLDHLSTETAEARTRARFTDPWPGTITLVAESDEGEVVGFAIAGPEREYCRATEGELYVMYVDKDHQGQGIGSALMKTAAEFQVV